MTNREANLKFWNSVKATTKEKTGSFTMRGGFKGTAIKAYHQIEEATAQWGAYGATWGLEDQEWTYIKDTDGNLETIVLSAVFFSPLGKFRKTEDTLYEPGRECWKKAETDLLTKCLSMLGFNADIFQGELAWEGNKFMNGHSHKKVTEREQIRMHKEREKPKITKMAPVTKDEPISEEIKKKILDCISSKVFTDEERTLWTNWATGGKASERYGRQFLALRIKDLQERKRVQKQIEEEANKKEQEENTEERDKIAKELGIVTGEEHE